MKVQCIQNSDDIPVEVPKQINSLSFMNSILLLSLVQCKHICKTLSSNDGDSLQDNGNNPWLHANLESHLFVKRFIHVLAAKFYCIRHNDETLKGWNDWKGLD